MKIKIQLYGRLCANLGSTVELEINNPKPTLNDVISQLIKNDPSLEQYLLNQGKLHQATILLVNGHVVDRSKTGLDTILTSKDQVKIDRIGFLEIVGGG
jgi:molybdopterin converting factor small subunit